MVYQSMILYLFVHTFSCTHSHSYDKYTNGNRGTAQLARFTKHKQIMEYDFQHTIDDLRENVLFARSEKSRMVLLASLNYWLQNRARKRNCLQ